MSTTLLDRLVRPNSVAVVGASANPSSFGGRTMLNLANFQGRVYPVNPKSKEIAGRKCFPDLMSLPEAPDCVVIAVPRDAVQEMVEMAGRRGAGGVVVYASGYQETGDPSLVRLQSQLRETAQRFNMPLLGPNCVGVLNYGIGFRATFANVPLSVGHSGRPAVALVSQSGAVGVGLLQAVERGVAVSHLLTGGNSCDQDVAGLVTYLIESDDCAAVACVLEGLAEPRKLLMAGATAKRRRKPIVICKAATGAEGAAASVSHTGTLAGSHDAYLALFRQAGFIVVDRLEDLVETAAFLAQAPAPSGEGIASLSGSGGAAIFVADRAEVHGVVLPQPCGTTLDALLATLPPFAALRNPCDLTAQILNDPQAMTVCAEAFLNDNRVAALVIPHTIAGVGMDRYDSLAELAARHGKIVCVVWTSEWLEGGGANLLACKQNIAVFHSTDRCMAAIAAWMRWHHHLAMAAEPVAITQQGCPELLSAGSVYGFLTEGPAKAVLARYGIPVVREISAASEEQAVAAATTMGYPVVIKIESADIPHKTEAGCVVLGVTDSEGARRAYQRVTASARQHHPHAHCDSVVVQEMKSSGVEILIGGRVDPLFGPMLTFGFGGVLVEILRGVQTALAPLSPVRALELLRLLPAQSLLDGYRGMPGVNLDKLADVISRASAFLVANAKHIDEFDINPLICRGDDICAVDALIRLADESNQALTSLELEQPN